MIGEIGGTAEEEAAAVHQGERQEAGRGLHRRRHRASGQAHGPRRARSSAAARARPRRSSPPCATPAYDFREKTQAVQVLIQALSTGDPEVVQKSHAQLVRLTGQDLPPEHLAWHEWFRANRTKWLLQRVQQPGSPK
jgi:hypothetical protein